MNLKNRKYGHEITAYVAIWLSVVLFPVILETWELINGHTFDWITVRRWWTGALTLFVVFALNNYLLMPKLLKKGRLTAYFLSVAVALVLFARPWKNT